MNEIAKSLLGLFSPDSKSGLQFLTGAWMLALTLMFLAAFVFPLTWVRLATQQLQLPQWVYGLLLVLVVQAAVVLLSSDQLVHGDPKKNAFVAAFRRNLPSAHLAERLGIEEDEAKARWFAQLDKWMSTDNPHNSKWERAIRLGYSCRFVYHLQTMALWLFWISASWLAVEMALLSRWGYAVTAPQAKIAVMGLFAAIWGFVRVTNRIGETHTTGVWRRECNINRELCDWIDQNLDEFKPSTAGAK